MNKRPTWKVTTNAFLLPISHWQFITVATRLTATKGYTVFFFTLHRRDNHSQQCLGNFLGVISQNPSVSKSNWLHIVIFRFFFINFRYILKTPVKWSVVFLKSWTSRSYFSTSTGSSVTSGRFSSFIDSQLTNSSMLRRESLFPLPLYKPLNGQIMQLPQPLSASV